jgi:hypothetical protein
MLERCCLLYLLLELEKLEMSGSCWVLCSLETLHALVLVHSMEVLFVYLVALLVDWPPHFFELFKHSAKRRYREENVELQSNFK